MLSYGKQNCLSIMAPAVATEVLQIEKHGCRIYFTFVLHCDCIILIYTYMLNEKRHLFQLSWRKNSFSLSSTDKVERDSNMGCSTCVDGLMIGTPDRSSGDLVSNPSSDDKFSLGNDNVT